MYCIAEISEALKGELQKGAQSVIVPASAVEGHVALLLTDSRSLSFPDQTLFFALVTHKGDGHRYVEALYQRGVRAFVIQHDAERLSKACADAVFFVVHDTLSALQTLAAWHRRRFDDGPLSSADALPQVPPHPVVGITGSNGKTVVKEWLNQLLSPTRRVVRSPRSYNSQVGVPLSVWQMRADADLSLFEAGISQVGEMARLETIIRPTVGILTNLGAAHESGFSSRYEKLVEKLRLFVRSRWIIADADLPRLADALDEVGITARRWLWSCQGNPEAILQVTDVRCEGQQMHVTYRFDGRAPQQFTLNMTSDAALQNVLQCLALMLLLGYDEAAIARGLAALQPLAMRLEVMEGAHGCLVINDAYSNDVTSLETALVFQQRRSSQTLRNTLVLSDIQQDQQDDMARCQMLTRLVELYRLHKVILIGQQWGNTSHLLLEAMSKAGVRVITDFYDTTDDFLNSDEMTRFHDELILLKGARSFQFERISDQLQLRRHETILQVNLDAIVHNLNQYRSRLLPSTRLTCMVKAFGYGTGSYELAKTLQDQNVDYLAVAVADEGADLRRQGIRVPIMVMNPEMSAFRVIIDNRLEPEIYSFRLLEAFIAETKRVGVSNYPVHVKVDSGMHRLGFQPHEIDELVTRLRAQSSVTVRSVFSHFATADDPSQAAFVHEQKRRFDLCADRLRAAFPHAILRHICNSAGIEVYPQYQMEMCRLGIGLYGFEAAPVDMTLEPVATLTTTILQIKEIPSDETVGYMRNGRLSRPSRVAMVPIGYADGYDRRLGNGHAAMMVHGRRCMTLGNVCMDVTFLDVTDCPEAREGDTVEVFGPHLSLRELADTLGTITYEVLSTVSARVKRVYYKE